jgi:hypothetical protein
MRRRRYLTTTVATLAGVSLAGCLGGDDDETDDATPTQTSTPTATATPAKPGEYPADEVQPADLTLAESDFPENWTRDDSLNDDFDAAFINGDQTSVVLNSIELGATVAQAKSGFETTKANFGELNDVALGDEAFWAFRGEQYAATVVRDSNVIGQTAAVTQSGEELTPDEQRAQTYAQVMVENWQSL